ncbi:MAG: hypothetical protein FJX59_08535 [Alphaproteobacteria bacterium]|nr:hypothetical protein [Alphaproteobacteria bacterium]
MRTVARLTTGLLQLVPMLAMVVTIGRGAWADETAPANQLLAIQEVSPPADHQIPTIDPLTLYDGEIVFDVFRKRSRVGEHRIVFARDGERLSVNAYFRLSVKVLFINAYTFDYQSTEIWDGQNLIGLSANVDDGGKLASITAKRDGELFRIDGPRGPVLSSSWVFPTNHWHRGQVETPTILNTLTGQLANITVVRKGIDRIDTANGPVDAEHFEYTGDLRDTDVWYDRDGRWVKMSFKAKDGSKIEYRCRRCGSAPAGEAGSDR